MVMSTATDQLKLRKIIPMQMMTKLRTICSLVINMPDTRIGRLNSALQNPSNSCHYLINRLTPHIMGSIHWN